MTSTAAERSASPTANKRDQDGFSLVELIIVVVILAILTAVAIPLVTGLIQGAKDAALEGIARNAATSVADELGDGGVLTGGTTVPAGVYSADGATVTITTPGSGAVTIEAFCVTASGVAGGRLDGGAVATSGTTC